MANDAPTRLQEFHDFQGAFLRFARRIRRKGLPAGEP
jgi:hypothetical protein